MGIRKKKKLESYDELREILRSYKKISPHILTNFVPCEQYQKWSTEETSYIYIFDSATFIVHDKGFMAELLFFSSDTNGLIKCINKIYDDIKKTIVLEHVIRENKDISIGKPTCILRRMSRTGLFEYKKNRSGIVEKATENDISALSDIFNSYFNPFTERIPDTMELKKLQKNGGISIIRGKNGILGMMIHEKDSSNIHLRYWWMSPEVRNMGYGSELLKDFFEEGKSCKRQFLWVFSDNHDAISKYQHYGFSFDGIADEIYITTK